MPLSRILEERYLSSLSDSAGLSSQSINQAHLGVFTRVVTLQPDEVKKIAEIYVGNMRASSFNDAASLFALIKLADVSQETRAILSANLSEGFIDEYKEDGNQDVANNAKILEQILAGAPMTDFQEKQPNQHQPSTTNTYNFSNVQNVAVHSPGAVQSVEVTNTSGLDEETRQLLAQLKEAIDKQDKTSAKKVLGYIADKGIDVTIGLLMGKYFGQG